MQNKILEIKANNGDAQAQNDIASKYYYGTDVEQNYEKAFKFAKMAADQGMGASQLLLSIMYTNGEGVEKDPVAAKDYQAKAKAQGFSSQKKTKVASSKPKSKKWLYISVLVILLVGGIAALFAMEKSRTYIFATFGSVDSQYTLACAYNTGDMGFDASSEDALEWFNIAAENGHAEAQLFLGKAYLTSKYGNPDVDLAISFLTKASDQNNADAQYELAKVLSKEIANQDEKDYSEIIELYTKSAKQNQADAQYELGMHYFNGIGIDVDLDEAIDLFTKSAEQYKDLAQLQLGICYLDAIGVDTDIDKAFKLFTDAEAQGNIDAKAELGVCYLKGIGTEIDIDKAIVLLNDSLNVKNPKAQMELGLCYLNGVGVKKSINRGLSLIKESVDQGNIEAHYQLGIYKLSKVDLAKTDIEKDALKNQVDSFEDAINLISIAADYDHLGAITLLAKHFETNEIDKDLELAVYYNKKLAENGDKDATCFLAKAYLGGLGVERDYAKSFKYFEELANDDNTDAYIAIANAYYTGNGVEQNVYKAITYYTKAAENNNTQALWTLGYVYSNGAGVSKDAEKAVEFFKKADELNYTPASFELANCYYNGEGVEANEDIALSYYTKAAENGNVLAKDILKYIEKKNNPDEDENPNSSL